MKKPRSDSKLKNLPAEQQARIADWCAQDSLQSAASRCASEMQLSVSLNTVSEFYAWWKLKATFSQAEAHAKTVEEMLRKTFPGATPEKIAAAGQLVFTMQAANAGDAEEFRAMEQLRVTKESATANARIAEAKLKQGAQKIAQKDQDLKLVERRVKLLEDREAKTREVLGDGDLTPAEKEQRIKAVFGILA